MRTREIESQKTEFTRHKLSSWDLTVIVEIDIAYILVDIKLKLFQRGSILIFIKYITKIQ